MMTATKLFSRATLLHDLTAGAVVFLVALPLCLGVALASNAPLFSGLLSGIVGGIVGGILSRSHTSVSGPSAGAAAIIAVQIISLGTFETFLLAVMVAGLIQMGLGIARAGYFSAFFPSSVVQGLLAAIGVILILKQIPHLFGDDTDAAGDMAFWQLDKENTLSEIYTMLSDLNFGAALIGLLSITLLMLWDRIPSLKKSSIPAPLVVVLLGIGLARLLKYWEWVIQDHHFVQIPVAKNFGEFVGLLSLPDFSQWSNPAVYTAGVTIAIVASLETLFKLRRGR